MSPRSDQPPTSQLLQRVLAARSIPCLALAAALLLPASSPVAAADSGGINNNQPAQKNLDLSSTLRSLLPTRLSRPAVTINEAGSFKIISGSTSLTPAERLAVYQLLSTGRQSILLGPAGNAVGGSFALGAQFARHFEGVTVPKGVTAIRDFSSASSLVLSGNLINCGSIIAVASSPRTDTAYISALNVNNQKGALLTSILPRAGLTGYANLTPVLNLSVKARQDLTNSGIISSSAALQITAGGTVANMAVSAAPRPLIQSVNELTIAAPAVKNSGMVSSDLSSISMLVGSLTNAGVIQAQRANVSIAGRQEGSLSVLNRGGVISAAGDILFSTATGTQPYSAPCLSVIDGDLSARKLEFKNGGGGIVAHLHEAKGAIYLSGTEASVGTSAGSLKIACADLSGDPFYYSLASGVPLDLSALFTPTFSTGGSDFVAFSGGDIVAPGAPAGSLLDASAVAGTGGKIRLGAGVTFVDPLLPSPINCANCNSYVITGASSSGGNIDLGGVSLHTNGSVISLLACAGKGSAGSISAGSISGSAAVISAEGSDTIHGDITTNGAPLSILAGRNIVDGGTAHQIDSSAAGAAGGNILLAAGTSYNFAGGTLSTAGASASGGLISLPALSLLDSRGGKGSTADFAGGTITVVAFGGSAGGSGTISLPASLTATTGGSEAGAAGSFTAIAGADNLGSLNSISLGSLKAVPSEQLSGTNLIGAGAGGKISIATAIPTGGAAVDAASGAIIANTFATSSSFTNASVQLGVLSTSTCAGSPLNGGNITVLAGDNISMTAGFVLSTLSDLCGTNAAITLASGLSRNASSGNISVQSALPVVAGANDWKTLGVTTPANTQGFLVGADLIFQFARNGSATPLVSANEALNSGSAVPEEITLPAGTILYKFVPAGQVPKWYSPYWTTADGKNALLANPGQIWNSQALPPWSLSGQYDIYAITALQAAPVFQSNIASAAILDTGATGDGGAVQVIAANRKPELGYWSPAVLTGTVSAAQYLRSSSLFGGTISLNARGSISIGSTISTSVFGSKVLMSAGAAPSVAGGKVSVSAANATTEGGQISLFQPAAGRLGSWGGDLTLVAFAGSKAGSGTITAGNLTPAALSSINTFGTGSGSAGNLLVIAGAKAAGTTSITLGDIYTNGGRVSTPSEICLATALPTGGSKIDYQSGSLSSTYAPGAVLPCAIASGSESTSGGDLTIKAGTQIKTNGLDASQSLGNGAGGKIMLQVQSGNIEAAAISARGYSGNGGSAVLLSDDILLSAPLNANGSSIDVSSGTAGSGRGGIISIQSLSAGEFMIGNTTSGNGTAGSLLSTGSTGGAITISSSGTIAVSSLVSVNGTLSGGGIYLCSSKGVLNMTGAATLNADGGRSGGQIYIQGPGRLSVSNDGLMSARNAANNSGKIGFNAGNGGSLTITGTGSLAAGNFVSAGNLDGNTLLPLPTAAGAQFSIRQSSILNRLLLSPILNPEAVSGLYLRSPALLDGLAAEVLSVLSAVPANALIATDRTPVDAWSRRTAQQTVLPEKPSTVVLASNKDCAFFVACDFFNRASAADFREHGVEGFNEGSNTYCLTSGNIFLAPAEDVVVRTTHCLIVISAGCQALVMEEGGSTTVLNFHDNKLGGVRVIFEQKVLPLAAGKEIILSRKTPEQIAANTGIACREARCFKLDQYTHAFIADFSVVDALRCLPALQAAMRADQPLLRRHMNRLVKTAAALTISTYGRGPFSSAPGYARR